MDDRRLAEKLLALAGEFQSAVLFDPSILKALPEVRGMCSADACGQYDANWACPPACGELDDCAGRIGGYKNGVLVQTVGTLEDEFDYEGMMGALKLHDERFMRLAGSAREIRPDCLALSAGACGVCESCAYPESCRFPEFCHPSMEAYGLFVSQVCADCGAAYNNGPLTITYTSCILV